MSDEPKSQVVLYQTKDGRTRLEVRFEGETVWLTQGQMVELFQTTKQNVSFHIQNIFAEKELEEHSVVKESLTTATVGMNYLLFRTLLHQVMTAQFRVYDLKLDEILSQPVRGKECHS